MVDDLARRALEVGREPAGGVPAHEVLAEVERLSGDLLRLLLRADHRVLLLERQAAGRPRRDDRVAGADERQKRRDVVAPAFLRRLEVAALEKGHSAAALGGHDDFAAVLLENRDGGPGDLGGVGVDGAGHEERDALVGRGAPRWARSRRRDAPTTRRKVSPAQAGRSRSRCTPSVFSIRTRAQAALVQGVDDGRRERRDPAHGVDRGQDALAEGGLAFVLDPARPVAQHEARDVDVPAMRRVVRDSAGCRACTRSRGPRTASRSRGASRSTSPSTSGPVEGPEEDVEGRAEVVAAPAGVADVGHPPQLPVDGRRIEETRGRRDRRSTPPPRPAPPGH